MFFYIKKAVAFAFALCLAQFVTTTAYSQQHFSSLQTLISAAKQYQPSLQQKQDLVNGAKANIIDVKHSYLPRTAVGDEVNLATDNSVSGAFLPILVMPSVSGGRRASNSFDPAFGNVASAYGEYQLSTFGLKDAQLKQAESYVGLAQGDLALDQYLLQWNLAKIYFELLRQEYQLGADRQNINRYDSIYTVIQAISLAGIRPGSDTSLALAELSKTRISYNQTLGRIAQAKQQLSYWSGVPAKEIRVDTVQQTANIFADSAANPLLDYFAQRKKTYETNELVVKRSFQPKLLLAADVWARGSGIDYNNDYKALATGLGYQRFNYAAGVSFTYDLFNPTHKKDRLAVAHFNTMASDNEIAQQKLSLDNLRNQADESISTALQNLNELPIQQTAAQAVFQQKVAQYRAGTINLIDLTNASFVLFRSQVDYIETLNSLLVSTIDKAAATGHLDQFIQLIK
jgi:outer membrane protein TolC